MSQLTIREEIEKQLDNLPIELQQRVLNFAQSLALSLPKGASGKQLLHFAGTIKSDDAELMKKAIENGCEQVDLNEW